MTEMAERSVVGRFAVVVHEGQCRVVSVMDAVAGEPGTPKRVRIQRDVARQGEVLMPSQYRFKCWADEEED